MQKPTLSALSLQKEIAQLSTTNFDSTFDQAFMALNVRSMLMRCKIAKQKGFDTTTILYVMLLLPLVKKSLCSIWSSDYFESMISARKDAYYRFLTNAHFNWRRFIYMLALRVMSKFEKRPLADKVLIADDTITAKTGKHIDLVSYHFDHAEQRSVLGHQWLQLAYQVATTLFPIDMAVHVSQKRPTCKSSKVASQSVGALRRSEGFTKKTDSLIAMLKRAKSKGLDAAFVLFDSWFAHDAIIARILKVGYEVLCRLKNGKARYIYRGNSLTLAQLWVCSRRHVARFDKSDLRAIKIRVTLEKSGSAAIVFVASTNAPNTWHAFLCTDSERSIADILAYYARRWAIEVFFKDAKQLLGLGKEQNTTFEALVASYSFVMIRYLILVSILESYTLNPSVAPLFHACVETHCTLFYTLAVWQAIATLMLSASMQFDDLISADGLTKLIDSISNMVAAQIGKPCAKV